jgi:phosphatidylinositol alpha-1,6-mannosyltransferase
VKAQVPITFFSEDRLGTSIDGQVVSTNEGLAAGDWWRGLHDPSLACFAARLDTRRHDEGRPVLGNVVGLPYYSGGREMVLLLPRMMVAVAGVVRQSSAVAVRLPGVVGLLAVVIAVIFRRRIVVELVGDIHEVLSTGAAGRLGAYAAGPVKAMTRWAIRRAHIVRYVTQSSLQATYPAHPRARVLAFSDVVLTNEDFAPSSTRISHRPQIVAVGSHEQMYKGHDLLITAVANLRSAGHDVSLTLLGQGRRQADLKAQADRLGIKSHVTFLGHVASRSALHEALDEAWVFAMPSRTEGLPRALVEAMARGKPCIVSDIGGMPELVTPDVVFESDDIDGLTTLLAELIVDGPRRGKLGARNRKVAEEFWVHSSQEAEEWQRVLREVAVGLDE